MVPGVGGSNVRQRYFQLSLRWEDNRALHLLVSAVGNNRDLFA